jgi:hypothetical protein
MKQLLLLSFISFMSVNAFAAGACVYTDISTSARLTICVDNVANKNACEHLNGINHKFFPDKTCDQLRKANQSNTSASVDRPIRQILAIADERGHVNVSFEFNGVDEFTQEPLVGTKIFYKGRGNAKILHGEAGHYTVKISNIEIRPTSYLLGEVSAELSRTLEESFRDLKILRSQMEGSLVLQGDAAAVLQMQQFREISVRGVSGTIESNGYARLALESNKFDFSADGFTLHPLLIQ